MVVICIYPLVLSRFGTVPMLSRMLDTWIFALGAVSIAIGMFIIYNREPGNRAVLSFGVLFLIYDEEYVVLYLLMVIL